MATRNTLTRSLSGLARAAAAAGLVGAVFAAQAAVGFVVTPKAERAVQAGMTQDDVLQVLGRPAHDLRFKGKDGSTWVYRRADTETVFDVDFGPDGKVVNSGARLVHFD